MILRQPVLAALVRATPFAPPHSYNFLVATVAPLPLVGVQNISYEHCPIREEDY